MPSKRRSEAGFDLDAVRLVKRRLRQAERLLERIEKHLVRRRAEDEQAAVELREPADDDSAE